MVRDNKHAAAVAARRERPAAAAGRPAAVVYKPHMTLGLELEEEGEW